MDVHFSSILRLFVVRTKEKEEEIRLNMYKSSEGGKTTLRQSKKGLNALGVQQEGKKVETLQRELISFFPFKI